MPVFLFFLGGGGLKFAVSCKMASRRGRSIAQTQMSETKVTSPKHLKFRSSLFKGLWESKGQSPWSLPQERNTPAHPNRVSKIKRRKAK